MPRSGSSPCSGSELIAVTTAIVKPSYPLLPTVWIVVAVTRGSAPTSSRKRRRADDVRVVVAGIGDPTAPHDVVGHDQGSRAGELERPAEVLGVAVLVGVEEDQVERAVALGDELREGLRAPARRGARRRRRSPPARCSRGRPPRGAGPTRASRAGRRPAAPARARSCCTHPASRSRGCCARPGSARAARAACPGSARRRSPEDRPPRSRRAPRRGRRPAGSARR